jgi:hypothetical protein
MILPMSFWPRLLLRRPPGRAVSIWDSAGAVGRIGRSHLICGTGLVIDWIRLSGFKCLLKCPAALLSFGFAFIGLGEPVPKLSGFAQKTVAFFYELRIPLLRFPEIIVGSFSFLVPRSLQLACSGRQVIECGFALSKFFFQLFNPALSLP